MPQHSHHPTRPRLARRLLALSGVAAVLLSSLSGLGAATGAHAAEPTIVLDRQHTDAVGVRYEAGVLRLITRADLDSGAGQLLDPAEVLFHLTDDLADAVPARAEFAFLGDPGTPIWRISQSYQPGKLWAGWETESLPAGEFVGDTVRLVLQQLTGPGRVELYLNDLDGPRRLLSSSDPALRTITEHVGAHTHANWVFDTAGDYAFTFVAEADLVAGGTISSAPQHYAFRVGGPSTTADDDPPVVPPPATQPPVTDPPGTDMPPGGAPDATTTLPAADTEEPVVEQCIATTVTTTVRPENVDVVNSGHFDFGPTKEGGALRAAVKDDRSSPPPWVDPGTLVFHLGDAAASPSPGFLGGGQVWQIPLTQKAGVPWLGWNTQHPSIAGKTQGPITLTLDGVEGPGQLAVYSENPWGDVGDRYFGTAAGFPRSTAIPVGATGVHVHGIWLFTAPGAYHVTLTFAGTVDGAQLSASSTLTFFVGAGDPRSAVRERTVTTVVGRTADGLECQLTLAATGPDDPELVADLAGIAGAALLVGLAYLGAAALAPRAGVTSNRWRGPQR